MFFADSTGDCSWLPNNFTFSMSFSQATKKIVQAASNAYREKEIMKLGQIYVILGNGKWEMGMWNGGWKIGNGEPFL